MQVSIQNREMVEMKETPIIFLTDMVKAILDLEKTMTRRVIKPQPYEYAGRWVWAYRKDNLSTESYWLDDCPYGQAGDRLWVRETWASDCTCENPKCNGVIYRTGYSGEIIPDKWRPSIFMPRWASRIDLVNTEIRVERVQEITTDDAYREGVADCDIHGHDDCFYGTHGYKCSFERLWNSLNAKRGYGWEVNPWVWVVSFRRLEDETK